MVLRLKIGKHQGRFMMLEIRCTHTQTGSGFKSRLLIATPSSQSESDAWKYWSNQKNSLHDFFVISYLIGMFITIALFVFFISYIEDYYGKP